MEAYSMGVFSIFQFFGWYFGNLNKNGLHLVFQLPNGDSKIQYLIENTTMKIFKQKVDYGNNTVIFGKINCNMVIEKLVRPPHTISSKNKQSAKVSFSQICSFLKIIGESMSC